MSPMGRNISQLLFIELENLEKDPETRRAAMKALKSYVKDLDSKTIPIFLSRASEIKDPSSPSGESIISLFEVLVRSHGRSIVPYINNIMDLIVKTLSSTSGSFALHQSCSKVVPAIARYCIDPLMLENEKARIVCSLSKPLSNVLMGSQENAASGAALCLKALVESDNWRFASDDVVNEVCLKVAGALEENQTQTASHMGLVMALLQHNTLIIDAYSRSLIRSGLQILTADSKEKNSQKRLSAIQMINFLMKCVDSRSICSEIAKIVDVLEESQNDSLPFVRGAAFEALQTAKIVARQRESLSKVCSSPFAGSNSDKIIVRNNPQVDKDDSGDAEDSDEFSVDSPLSLGKSSCNVENGRRASRRLWGDAIRGIHAPNENGFCRQALSSSDSSIVHLERFKDELSEPHAEHLESLPAQNIVARSFTSSPPRSRPQLIDNANIYYTPRKLNGPLRNTSSANFRDHVIQHSRIITSPASVEVEWKPNMLLNRANSSQNLNHTIEARVNGSMKRLHTQQTLWDGEHLTNESTDCPCTTSCIICCKGEEKVQMKKTRSGKSDKAVLGLFSFVLIAVILSIFWIDNDKVLSDVVPT
ncbi:uncharacterized protein LOC109832953 isoform X2 [Asparagus officinalis]|uniref:uncharacterized protein LOC109832953 isoform X1 n=1 Tax=Asparagus officinalis TaxID=4686 RepID=UPI00098E1731|nr:uncharacterized protein LOC109832953 isoform X1 [Asparagus officinalis]XP_020256043.1 uncharacterized protein LOC109832953 isoform X2 [Asparagus officinalis]